MIGAAGSINPLAAGELVPRQSRPEDGAAFARQQEADLASAPGDAVNLSAEAIALARNVPPAGETPSAGEEQGRQGRDSEEGSGRGGRIDIRA